MSDARTIHLLYGKTGLDVTVPASTVILQGPAIPALPDPVAALRQALGNPLGAAPLRDLLCARRPRSVAITISDITRPVPNPVILPVLLETLSAEGVRDEQVTIIIGTGLHRPSTPQEREELVGPEVLRRCNVIDHRADDPALLARIADDPPVSVNAAFLQAEFRIVTGLIEPHFMAGFSGGRKGVCPALVDLGTVQRFHGHRILADARCDNGLLKGNPCHRESLRVARLVGVDFLVNVALDRHRRIAGVYCGHMEKAHETGCAQVAQWNTAAVAATFDLVVTNGGGYPLDRTFYQTVKGMVTALPALHEGSTLLVAADCGEGVGSPQYADTMSRWHGDFRGFLKHIAATPEVVKDQWQYQMQARVLERIGVANLRLVCDGLPTEVQGKLAVTPVLGEGDAAKRLQRAVDDHLARNPQARVAVIPEGPYTMLAAEHGAGD